MKCKTFYEDQCYTSCFKSEGTKITECPSYFLYRVYFVLRRLHFAGKLILTTGLQINKDEVVFRNHVLKINKV